MSILTYDLFVKQYGLRRPTQIRNPRISTIDELKLPKGSVYHFIGDGVQNGPDSKDPLFSEVKRVMPMLHVTELEETRGNPRLLPGQPQQWIRDYHVKNRRFRKMLDIKSATRDVMVPTIVNYALIDRRYRYIENQYKLTNRWHNLEITILKSINEMASESDFQHFVELQLPKTLPSIQFLKEATKMMNLSILKRFDDGNAFLILEFWKWLGFDRKDSILSLIEPKNYHKVNFIIKDKGYWTTFNLGTLNQMRVSTDEERQSNPDAPTKGFEPKMFQKLFLNYLMQFMQARNGVENIEALNQVEAETDKKISETRELILPENKTVDVDTPAEVVDSVDDATDTKTTPEETRVVQATKDGITVKTQTVDSVQAKANDTPDKDTVPTVQTKEVDDNEQDFFTVDKVTGEFILDKNLEARIQRDLDALEEIGEQTLAKTNKVTTEGHYTQLKVNDTKTPAEKVMEIANVIADEGGMTAAEYRRYERLGSKYKEILYPGTDKTLEEMSKITKEELTLEEPPQYKDNPTVFDKSMLTSRLDNFDKQYLEKTLDKDMANVFLSLQNAGLCVTDVEKEHIEDATGAYDSYRVKVQPVEGAASTLWIKVPSIDDNLQITSGNTRYSYRKSRIDLPLRKIAPDKVTLTSYYGKNTAIRSNKKITDYADWLTRNITVKGLDSEDDSVLNLRPANSFDSKTSAPRLFTLLSMKFMSFEVGGYTWYFDHKQRTNIFTPEEVETFEVDGALLVGKSPRGDLLLMDKRSYLYNIKYINGVPETLPAPTIETMLGLDRLKAPIDIVGLKVLGKIIPIGFILAYHLGLENLINSLGVSYRRVPKDGRLDLTEDEYRLVFADESLIFSREDAVAAMILAGLKDFHRELKKYSVYDFDRKDVYLNLLEAVGLSVRYLREIDLLFKLFIDPITKDVLEEMNEPTTFMGLLIRTVELLTTDDHPDEIDPRYMRIRGFERIPGTVYNEFVKAIRIQNSRAGKKDVPIDLNPYAVWRSITSDPAMMTANEINPIQSMKEVEAVTYSGNGGRTSRTMVKHTREYHPNDVGTMSEATVDSSDVGINVFLSSNPNFQSVRGISRAFNPEIDGASSIGSPTALVCSTIDLDDDKRKNFGHIQASHGVASDYYQVCPVRTGYESIMVNRVGDMFATKAKQDGVVTAVDDEVISVTYKDGTVKGFKLGTQFGSAAGLTIPHRLTTDLKVGQKFKAGDILSYNSDYFVKDRYSDSLSYKSALLANVVVYETGLTDEDSSVISRRLGDKLMTRTTKIRDIVLDFGQEVRELVKVGEALEADDILCIIEDSVTANSDAFDKESLDTLRSLGSQTPTAKVKGVVEKIEVFYNGDLEEMSDSIRKLAGESNKRLAKECKAMGKQPYTGEVNEGFRVDGNPLMLDTAVVRVYITSDVGCSIGDEYFVSRRGDSV